MQVEDKIFFLILIYVRMSVHVYAEGCQSPTITYSEDVKDSECSNKDCSQGSRFTGDGTFPCTISGEKGWDFFIKERGTFDNNITTTTTTTTTARLNPPIITSIEWYRRPYTTTNGKKEYNPSFRFTFEIPNNISSYAGLTEYKIKAVRMRWCGIKTEDPWYQDTFYSRVRPRIRLFDFTRYTSIARDREMPRTITYSCITGLDTCNSDKKFYSLELAALAMYPEPSNATLVYNVTTFNQQGTKWKPAIATAIHPHPCSVYVVFEPAPKQDEITKYVLQLGGTRITLLPPRSTYAAYFHNVTSGTYKLQVHTYVYGSSNATSVFTAYRVNITSQECKRKAKNFPISLPKDEMKLIVPPLVGIVAAIILVLLVACIVQRRRSHPKAKQIGTERKLFILYSNRSKSDEKEIKDITNFILKKMPTYHVISDVDTKDDLCSGVQNWYQKKIEQAAHVLVVCPRNWNNDQNQRSEHTHVLPYFYAAWNYACGYGDNNNKDSKWLMLLCFPFSDVLSIPLPLKDKPKYHLDLPKDLCKGKSDKTLDFKYFLKGLKSKKQLLKDIKHNGILLNNANTFTTIEETECLISGEPDIPNDKSGALMTSDKDDERTEHMLTISLNNINENEEEVELDVDPLCPIHGKEIDAKRKIMCPVHRDTPRTTDVSENSSHHQNRDITQIHSNVSTVHQEDRENVHRCLVHKAGTTQNGKFNECFPLVDTFTNTKFIGTRESVRGCQHQQTIRSNNDDSDDEQFFEDGVYNTARNHNPAHLYDFQCIHNPAFVHNHHRISDRQYPVLSEHNIHCSGIHNTGNTCSSSHYGDIHDNFHHIACHCDVNSCNFQTHDTDSLRHSDQNGHYGNVQSQVLPLLKTDQLDRSENDSDSKETDNIFEQLAEMNFSS